MTDFALPAGLPAGAAAQARMAGTVGQAQPGRAGQCAAQDLATGHPRLEATVAAILVVYAHRPTSFVQCRYWNSAVFSNTHASSKTSPALPSPAGLWPATIFRSSSVG